MANKVTIEVEAVLVDEVTGKSKYVISGLDDIEKAANDAQKGLDKLGKKKVNPIIDADNNKLLKKLRESESKIARIAGKTATATLKVLDKGTSIVNKMESGLKKVAGKTWTTVVKIKDLATAPLRGIKNMLFSVKSLVMAITAGLAAKQLVLNPINLADAYSSAQIGFSTLLGESAGQQMMDEIDEFAKATPFKTSGVISNVQKMMAYGWDVDRVIDDMETIGDAAAATGKGDQGLESIVYALSEIRSKGKLSTQELNQLASAGIKAKAYLAEGLGFGTDDAGMKKLAEALEAGEVGANQAIDLILQGMKEFDGMMDKTANETVEGLWSQIQDTFEINVFRKWGQGLQDGAKRGFGTIVELLDKADTALSKFGDTLYEIGHTISNWAADKLEKAVERITNITDSYEFQNADLGEKISMLWKGVIVDPLKEWWENGGQEKTAETAGKIGGWIGKMLTEGLLALFGATDVLKDIDGADVGGSVAGSFVQGFLQNFDGSAITDAFVQAIKNVWNALPTWAQVALGVYGGAKTMGGIANLAGGVASFIGSRGVVSGAGAVTGASGLLGAIGRTGVAGVGSSGILGGLANAGYSLVGGTSALTMGGGMAALAGGAGIAGGLAGGASLISGGLDLYKGYTNKNDATEAKAKKTSGWSKIGGVGAGAAAGAAIGSVIPGLGTALGALIGAGVGGVAGWFGGEKWADSIRESKEEVEDITAATRDLETEEEKLEVKNKMIWENMKSHMGDISLSMAEIQRLADQIVWGEDLSNFEKFTAATQNAEANLQSMKTAAANADKWMWKASLGVKFNDDEKESFKASFDDYINAAKSFVENKHYEFTAAVDLLVDIETEEGKAIIDSGNAFFAGKKEELESLGTELNNALASALEDDVISTEDKIKVKIAGVEYELNEQEAISKLQAKIAEVTTKLANAEQKAELELIKVKFGGGNLDLDSFDGFMTQMQTTIDERMTASDKAFTASVSALNLQLEEDAITEDEYNKQLETLISGYKAEVKSLQAEIKDVELQIIGDAYAEELGKDAKEKLNKALDEALKTGVDPVEWTDKELCKLLGVDNLSESTAGAIKQMLSGVMGQIKLLEVDGKIYAAWDVETKGEKPEEQIKDEVPETVKETVGVNISGEKEIQNKIDVVKEDFGVPEEHAATVAMLLYGDKDILNQIDVSQLAKEFGIPESQAKKIIEKLTGEKEIQNKINVLADDFGIPDVVTKTVKIKINGTVTSYGNPKMDNAAKQAQLYNDEQGYRGGIFGGDSAMDAFARGGMTDFPNGGIVGGSTRFIRVNEESPEMIIPLSSQRRDRALKLWAKTGELLDAPGFARGGHTGQRDEGIRFQRYGAESHGDGQAIQIDVGGITLEIYVNGTDADSIAQAIKAQVADIAEDVAGIMADAFAAQFENTPVRGGAA